MKRSKLKKRSRQPIAKLKRELDRVFSLWIRVRDNGTCFTCGVRKAIDKMQNGHFVSRTYLSLRWDERNCHCQCVGCNIFKHGHMDAYAQHLVDKYGAEILTYFAKKKRQTFKPTEKWLTEQIEKYKNEHQT